jgi:hypothetical protein
MMNKLVRGAAILAFGTLSSPAAFAQDMTVTSAEVSEGSTIKDAQVANVFGCKGRQYLSVLELERGAE